MVLVCFGCRMGCNSSKASVGPVMAEEAAQEDESGQEVVAVRTCEQCRSKAAQHPHLHPHLRQVDENGQDLPAISKPREEREVPEGGESGESGDHEELIGESLPTLKSLHRNALYYICLKSYVILLCTLQQGFQEGHSRERV